ncbi:MAG: FAD-binding oxidoreductase [Candidatus Thermoplasmatota archaeon]
MAETRKAVVVGGGALGAGSALALAERGFEVTLHERRSLGAGATGKAAGILSTLCHSDAEYRLIAETRGLVGELMSLALAAGCREARGAWRSHASIVVGGGASVPTLDAMQDRVERFTEECERLDHRQAARTFPGVQFAPGEQILVAQEDGVLEAGDLMAALRARLGSEGVTIREGLDAPGPDRDAVHVVAGGAWTKGYLARLGVPLAAQMYRTQLASLAFPAGGELPIVHDLTQHFYTRPESADSILAGNGTQLRPFDPEDYNEKADPEFIESIAARVVARFEEGGAAQVRTGWAGLCVATPDRRPLCGPVPGRPGLFVVTGDNGFGLMRSLALGQRLAESVQGRVDPALDPARFGPESSDRFVMAEGYGATTPVQHG